MSRAYRIRVRETLRRVLRAHDHVSTRLELLPILPTTDMAGLLHDELTRRGFRAHGGKLVRSAKGVTVTVEPESGTVAVQAEGTQQADLEAEQEGIAIDDRGQGHRRQVEHGLREQARQDLERRAAQQTDRLQAQVAQRLEGQLGDLRQELDQAVNRVTAEALKRKAAQLGQIKEMTEDTETGSLTITLEV